MSEDKKPYWTEEQIAAMKEYCQSEEFINHINKRYREQQEQELKDKLRFTEWWAKNKDIPYM
mgnify:CR=1 FL=1